MRRIYPPLRLPFRIGTTDAGICNAARNVLGLMSHPERCAEPILGNAEGPAVLKSIAASFANV
jgi:phosphoribosylformylglycinamidine (FGAM) synthase-like amidotransferase family enzyme